MPKQINAKLYRLAKTQTDIDMQNQWRDMLTKVADSGALLIDGANIAADTIYGRSIVAESITADKIKAGSITADHITSGGITADVLTGGSLESIVPLAEGGSLLNFNTGDFNLAGGNLTWNNTTKVLTLNASQIIIGEQEVATKEDIEQIELTPGPRGDPGEDAYKVEVHSTNGNVFRNNIIDTWLFAVAYKGGEDITSQLNDSQFRWERSSNNSAEDQLWNDRFAGGMKEFKITSQDIYHKATFDCYLIEV